MFACADHKYWGPELTDIKQPSNLPNGQSLRRIGTLFARCRLRGFSGLYHSLKYNLYGQDRIIRFRVDLDNWQALSNTPASLQIQREALAELIRFREQWTEGLLPEDFYADRVFGLGRVWLGLWQSKIAHINWITSEIPTVNIPLEPGTVELRNGHTLEDYRGRRIGPYVISAILDDLRREGVSTVVTYVREDNTSSRKMVARVGFHAVETLTSNRLCGFVRLGRDSSVIFK